MHSELINIYVYIYIYIYRLLIVSSCLFIDLLMLKKLDLFVKCYQHCLFQGMIILLFHFNFNNNTVVQYIVHLDIALFIKNEKKNI